MALYLIVSKQENLHKAILIKRALLTQNFALELKEVKRGKFPQHHLLSLSSLFLVYLRSRMNTSVKERAVCEG